MMGATATRGVYTDETKPYVFINEHTKVICQGMTGKHVSIYEFSIFLSDAEKVETNLCSIFLHRFIYRSIV